MNFTIHHLPPEERPRERMQHFGSEALSTQELLALILGRGVSGESVMVTAQRLLMQFPSLEALANASLEELCALKGIGIAKACQIRACMEMGRRVNLATIAQARQGKIAPTIFSPKDVFRAVQDKLTTYTKEHFFALSFDTKQKLLGVDTVAIGILNASLVHPRETFTAALRRHASHLILAHNHPSGDTSPSEEDIVLTERLAQAGALLGIEVLDHVIVTKTDYLSLRDEGFLTSGGNELP